MRKIILSIICVFLFTSLFSQNYEEKLAYVRKNFSEIESNLKNYTEKTYNELPDPNYPPSAYFSFYYDNTGHLKKAQRTAGEEGYSQNESYYFADGKFIFYYAILKEPEYIDGGTFFREDESRIYLYNEEIFEYLYKVKEPEDNEKISDKKNIKGKWDLKMKNEMLESAANIIEISRKAE